MGWGYTFCGPARTLEPHFDEACQRPAAVDHGAMFPVLPGRRVHAGGADAGFGTWHLTRHYGLGADYGESGFPKEGALAASGIGLSEQPHTL